MRIQSTVWNMVQNCFRRRSYAIRKARFLFMSRRICFARRDLAPVRTPILFFKRTNPFSPLLNICMRTFLAFEIWPFSHRIDTRLELYMSPRFHFARGTGTSGIIYPWGINAYLCQFYMGDIEWSVLASYVRCRICP